MIRITFCLRRLPGVAPADFHHYWHTEHGPLVAGFAATLGIKRYVQAHATAPELGAALRSRRGTSEPFDGVAEIWYEDLAHCTAAGATPEGRAALGALIEDERRFIDFSRSSIFVTEEKVIVG